MIKPDFLNDAPDASPLLHVRELAQAGDISSALTALNDELKERPGNIQALLAGVDLCMSSRRFGEANVYLTKAIHLDEKSADVLLKQAQLLLAQGFLGKAVTAADVTLAADPGNVGALMVKGQCLITTAQHQQKPEFAISSIEYFDAILEHVPTHFGALMQSAVAYEMIGDIREAEIRLVKVCELAHGWSYTYRELAMFYIRHRQFAKALEAFDICIERNSDDKGADAQRVFLLERLNRLDEAKVLGEELLGSGVNSLTILPHLARAERRLGNIEKAREYYNQIITDTAATDDHKAIAYYELGRMADKQGDYEAAMGFFQRANAFFALTPAAQAQDGEQVYTDITARQAWLEAQDNAVFARWSDVGLNDANKSPVFLMGFMRSGTTLMEQMLLAHPNVASLQEYPVLTELIAGMSAIIGRNWDYPDILPQLSKKEIGLLRKAYWQLALQHTLDDEVMESPVVIDKMPFNLIHAELIARIFPDSPIIVMERDARDVKLSCFMQDFDANPATVEMTAKDSIDKIYAAMTGYWESSKAHLSLNVLTVEYEALVSDFEAEIRKVLTHIGVEWDDEISQFHTTVARRSVTTPSYENVIEPVYTRSIGRWKHYGSNWE